MKNQKENVIPTLIGRIKKATKNQKNDTIRLSYDELKEILPSIKTILNLKGGYIVLIENNATIFFDEYPYFVFMIKNRIHFEVKDFEKIAPGFFKILGPKERITFWRFINKEIRERYCNLLIILTISCPFLLISPDKELLEKVSLAILSSITIFISIYLAFVLFFYNTNRKQEKYYLDGEYYNYTNNDRFIARLSLWIIALCIVVIMIISFKSNQGLLSLISEHQALKQIYEFAKLVRFYFAGFIILICLFLLYLCLESVISFYFDRIKFENYRDAINSMREKIYKE